MIDISTIERELRQLWKEGSGTTSGGQAMTRALTLNLVARAQDSLSAEQMSAVIQQLTASHPSRAVLARLRPALEESRLEAFVQANCMLVTQGAPQICGEQITIDAQGSAVTQVASLVLALLVPDLPVALWLPGPAPLEDPLLLRLRGVITRLIVDTRDAHDAVRALAHLAAFQAAEARASRHVLGISDLAWAILTPWRELIAQFFDTRPLLPHLQRIDQVLIKYQPGERRAGLALSLLLAGWLTASLGWIMLDQALSVEEGTVRLHLRRPAVGRGPNAIRLITIDLIPVTSSSAEPPAITALCLRAIDGVSADFCVEQGEETNYATTRAHVAGHPPISRLVRCEIPTLTDLLAAELRLLNRDQTFAAALQSAGIFAEWLPV